jgi:hypothetical protein
MFFEQSVWSELRAWFSICLNPKSTELIVIVIVIYLIHLDTYVA